MTAKVSFWRSWRVSRRSSLATHSLGGAESPDAGRNVEVVGIEQHPRLRLLGGGRALVGRLLDEARDGRDGEVDALVELPVQPDALGKLDGANRGPPPLVAADDVRRERGRRSVDGAHAEPGRTRRTARCRPLLATDLRAGAIRGCDALGGNGGRDEPGDERGQCDGGGPARRGPNDRASRIVRTPKPPPPFGLPHRARRRRCAAPEPALTPVRA